LWQSFDYPGNTLIPGMKVGWNIKTGMDWYVTSWKSPDDPSRGNITGILVPEGYPELLLLEDSKPKHRAEPCNGLQFSGMPQVKPNPVYIFEFVYNDCHTSESARHRLAIFFFRYA